MAFDGRKLKQLQSNQRSPLKAVSFMTLWSGMFWALLSIVFVILFFNLKTTPGNEFKLWPNGSLIFQFIQSTSLLVGISFIFGVTISLPASFCLLFTFENEFAISRRNHNLRWARNAFRKSAPGVLLGLAHFTVLTLSFAAAPRFSRTWSEKPNFIYQWSQFIHNVVFLPVDNKEKDKWTKGFSVESTPQNLFIFLPSKLLATKNRLPQTEKLLGEYNSIYLDSTNMTSTLNRILGLPIQFQSASSQAYLTEATTGLLPDEAFGPQIFGDNYSEIQKNVHFFLAPEHRRLEQQINNEQPIRNDAALLIRVRLAQTQAPLFLLFRQDFLSFFTADWKWEKLVSDDLYLIQKLFDMKKKTNKPSTFLQLTELEEPVSANRSTFAPLSWPPYFFNSENHEDSVKQLDHSLAIGLNQLLKLQVSIFILPYPEITNPKLLSHFITNKKQFNNIIFSDLFPLKISDLNFANLLNGKENSESLDTQKPPKKIGLKQSSCTSSDVDFDSVLNSESQIELSNIITIDNEKVFRFSSAFSYLVNPNIEHVVLCRSDKINFDQNTAFIIRFNQEWEKSLITPEHSDKKNADSILNQIFRLLKPGTEPLVKYKTKQKNNRIVKQTPIRKSKSDATPKIEHPILDVIEVIQIKRIETQDNKLIFTKLDANDLPPLVLGDIESEFESYAHNSLK